MSNSAVIRNSGFKFRGLWSNASTYAQNDIVVRNNNVWVAIQANINTDPYTDNGTNWTQFAGGFFYRSTWLIGTTYSLNDVVSHQGSTYVSITSSNLGNIPASSPANWSLMATAGQVAPRQTFNFTMPQASVSNISLTSNVVTVTTSAAHGFSAGNTVYMSGLTTATYLNNQILTIASAPTSTSFTASFTNVNDPSHSDTGTATRSIPNNGVFTTTIPLGKTFALSRIQCNQASRIELYSTVAARTADSSRPPNTQPTVGTQHGVIVDLYLDGIVAAFSSWVLSPLAYGANLEDGTVNIPTTLTNISGVPSTNSFSVTFVFTYEEQ